jgi:hypothetical protein
VKNAERGMITAQGIISPTASGIDDSSEVKFRDSDLSSRVGETSNEHQLANRTFADAGALHPAIHDAVDRLNDERQPHSSPNLIRPA